MNAGAEFADARAQYGERLSTRIAFLIAGLLMSAWAPLVPLVKQRVGLDDGSLGLLLLGLGGGSIVAMPFAGYLTAHYGCRPVIIFATIALCAVFPVLSTVIWLPGLVIAVIFFGASMGMLDCAMNIQSVIVEKNSGQALQSGFHGLYSVGGILGAGAMTALLSVGLDPLIATLCIVAVVMGALYKAAPALLVYGTERGGPLFAIPRGIVLLLGMLCFIIFMTEGVMLDWSAVFLVSHRGLDPSIAGLGYASFAAAMTVGRLTGDAIVSRLGGVRVIALGGLCAAAGMAVSLGFDGWPASLVGYALVGAGCSNIVPVLFTAVGRQQRMPQAVAIPAVISMGYAGILLGPVVIGAVAHLSSLSVALSGVIVLLVFVSATARSIKQ
ncbi:MFS transporter [Pseudomonas sp. B21-053]|uniref:MFS transporter n=1 Tax=Pseudomonas sp. B21-053 TaxID=2895493 RepID=UPI002231D945|nr:MFS transporter [Pseudomonas sp. B21-053]UZE09136.1 MFS transporter [Pseudomonas sp. B21-053]